jgi:uncharacterized protein
VATRFAWDEKKNRANRRKHRIGFETALLVFDDPNAIALQDREIVGEQRWQTIGWAHTSMIVVAHKIGEEDGDEVIRIISARKATPSDRTLYEEEID